MGWGYKAVGEVSGVMELFDIVIVMVDKSICPNLQNCMVRKVNFTISKLDIIF